MARDCASHALLPQIVLALDLRTVMVFAVQTLDPSLRRTPRRPDKIDPSLYVFEVDGRRRTIFKSK